MARHSFFVLATLLALAPAAHAADIQVGYRVDAKSLKSNTPAGTPLTFQLYTDSTCATSAGGPQVVNVENVTLIEAPKLVRVKNGPKPPQVAEISYTMTGITPLPAFYAKVTGAGITPIGSACQLQPASVGGTIPPPPSCLPDSVLSGSTCMDKYEATLWQIPPGATTVIQHVQDGTVTLAELTGAGATQLSVSRACTPAIPGTLPNDGNYTAPLYAVSIPGVVPTTCISAFQAEAACTLSGKRLPSNTEWTQAAQGTLRAFTDNGTTSCNVSTAGTPLNTGSRSACVSTAGAFDMLGNVWEWTQDSGTWIRGGSWFNGSYASVLFAYSFSPDSSNFNIGSAAPGRCAAAGPSRPGLWPLGNLTLGGGQA
jgi:hypothetical protein